MKNIKKIISIVAVVAIVAAMGLGAFSYFTDYATETKTGTAGTLDIKLTQDIDLDGELDILNPGDVAPFVFNVANEGNKSADLKAVITVTAKDKDGKAMTAADHEFKILNGADELAGWVVDEDDANAIVYTIDGITLNGVGDKAETETGITETAHNYEYSFTMDADAKNAWQAAGVTVKLEIFAKQHRNTEAGWNLINEFEVVAD